MTATSSFFEDWAKTYQIAIRPVTGQYRVTQRGKLLGNFDTEGEAEEYIDRSARIDAGNSSYRKRTPE